MKEIKIRRFETLFQSRWTHSTKKRFGAIVAKTSALCGAIIILLAGCKTIYVPVPATTSTTVTVKDSTIWNIKDSVRITEKSRYKDFGDLLKPLVIDGNHSHMRSWVDSTRNILVGTLEEDEITEKIRTEYRDKYIYKDSIQLVEKPVPVDIIKEKKIYPKWLVLLSILGVISTLVLGFIGYLKIKSGKFLNLFRKS